MARAREELEALLLKQPFDADARAEYAEALLAAGASEEALAQADLVAQQKPDAAAGHVLAARCLLALGRVADASARYARARPLAGFAPDPDLERSLAAVTPLRAVAGGRGEGEASVVPISRVPPRRFADIVGMRELKKTIRLRIIEPFLRPGLFARFAKKSGGGILLYGPPGCGKTLIARAIATECEAAFLAVGISDILNMWIGESERNLASVFEKARAQRPAVLFFDELDALAFSRSKAHSEHTRTLVNEFLAQLDGLSGHNEQVLVLAATNMPWDVDPAMKRPGRFDRQIFVPPPGEEARAEMFRQKLAGVPCEDIDFAALARATPHASGADIDGIVDAAKERVLAEILDGGAERPLRQADLAAAARDLQPSTLDWLRTARNLVKYSGADSSYKDVEAYLRHVKLL